MPKKLKTKSSVKKRFSVTGSGKIRITQAGKRHGMIKRSKRSLRTRCGMKVATSSDAKIIKLYMPYSR